MATSAWVVVLKDATCKGTQSGKFNDCRTGKDFLGKHESQRANRLSEWATATEPLTVTFEMFYEPYVIVPTQESPRYDERCVGANSKVSIGG